MNWPPVMAWTSLLPYKQEIYFVAINYGMKNKLQWVEMVSVLNGDVSLRVSYKDLNDSLQWLPGWVAERKIPDYSLDQKTFSVDSCLKPSNDSGLSLPIYQERCRPWFD